jgi:dTDP-4-dehydrorhamnose reductase
MAQETLPRLLVVGARGFLGTFVAGAGGARYEVVRADRSAGPETDVVMDVADEASVRAAMDAVRPDAVVLLAAISDIDKCEREPALAEAVNLRGAEYVANACARSGTRLLFTSTGAIFDGLKIGYTEEDEPTPLSVYGVTKAKAEAAVLGLMPSAVVIRVSLVMGLTGKASTNSQLDRMKKRWAAGETILASTVETRNPIDAATQSEWVLELVEDASLSGIYNTGCMEPMSRYEMYLAFAKQLGVPERQVIAETVTPPERANRGIHQWLLTDKINRVCRTQAPSAKQVIERSLNEVAEGSLRA